LARNRRSLRRLVDRSTSYQGGKRSKKTGAILVR
jgi:hypothetical protein